MSQSWQSLPLDATHISYDALADTVTVTAESENLRHPFSLTFHSYQTEYRELKYALVRAGVIISTHDDLPLRIPYAQEKVEEGIVLLGEINGGIHGWDTLSFPHLWLGGRNNSGKTTVLSTIYRSIRQTFPTGLIFHLSNKKGEVLPLVSATFSKMESVLQYVEKYPDRVIFVGLDDFFAVSPQEAFRRRKLMKKLLAYPHVHVINGSWIQPSYDERILLKHFEARLLLSKNWIPTIEPQFMSHEKFLAPSDIFGRAFFDAPNLKNPVAIQLYSPPLKVEYKKKGQNV